MKAFNFAKRNFKEIMRDPLSWIFSIALPLILLVVFQQIDIPGDVYKIENFTPGIVIFSFSFISLFTATLVAKDRSTSLISRLCASPMTNADYIMGYTLAILPMVLMQNILFFTAAIIMGLKFTINIIFAVFATLPISLLFIGLGILIGSFTNEKSSGGVGSVVAQLVAFTSGMYFPDDILGKGFTMVCKILPFHNCLTVTKAVMNGNYDNILVPLLVTAGYTVVIFIGAALLFSKKLRSDNK